MTRKCPFAAKRSHRAGLVELGYAGRTWSAGASIAIKLSDDISTEHARELAAELIRLADEADAKVAKEVAAKARRKAWTDREVAAGRMKLFSAAEFFGR